MGESKVGGGWLQSRSDDRQITIPTRCVSKGPKATAKIAACYTRANKAEVALLLETLVAVGNVRQLDHGRFAMYKRSRQRLDHSVQSLATPAALG